MFIHKIFCEFLQSLRDVGTQRFFFVLEAIRYRGLRFYLVLDFWLAWSMRVTVLSFQHVYLTQIQNRNLPHAGLPVL